MFMVLIRYGRWAFRLAPLLRFQLLGVLAVLLLWLRPSAGMFISPSPCLGSARP